MLNSFNLQIIAWINEKALYLCEGGNIKITLQVNCHQHLSSTFTNIPDQGSLSRYWTLYFYHTGIVYGGRFGKLRLDTLPILSLGSVPVKVPYPPYRMICTNMMNQVHDHNEPDQPHIMHCIYLY